MMRFWAGIIGCVLLAGCTSTGGPSPSTAVPDTPPANYKEITLAYLKQTLFDPYSVRDASLSIPQKGGSAWLSGWVTCFRANSKNRFGAYTGISDTAITIRDGKVVNAQTEYAAMWCSKHVYEPFPEIEQK
jgi:hypothetical protein